MKRKFVTIMLLFVTAFLLVGCGNTLPTTETPTAAPTNSTEAPSIGTTANPYELKYSSGTELKMGVVHNSTSTTITFQDSKIVGEGLTLADGVTYQLGDLKPVWKQLQSDLDVKFNNVYTGATSAQKEYKAWKALNFEGVDVLVGNAADISEDGKNGYMVNLADYLDYMPNFKKFLEDNPIVYLSIVSDTKDGDIYYAPYFDGFDDIEKYFLMRVDWIEALLDGEGAYACETSDTFGSICKTTKYTPFMQTEGKLEVTSLTADGSSTQTITKDYTTSYGNIISYMNANVTSETTGVELVNMLRGYIDKAYNGYYGTTRSHLFSGYDACWDADELVALLRCVVTNTYKLTGQNTTKVTGLFPRESSLNRTADLFSLASMFGVRGYESRNDYLYFNAQGELCDARADSEYADAINKLNQLYSEGLILADFDTYSGTIYKDMYQKNLGFGLYDYVQTQCLYDNDPTAIKAAADAGLEFNLTAVINPVSLWYDGTNLNASGADQGTYMRFTESWRSVKTNGWCIPSTCKGETLQAALKLFDYVYSDEGSILMSYGPEAWRTGNTIDYKGQQVPELNEACLAELWDKAGGNYTNYARMYLGSTLPIGFVKDQGMEYQCTTEKGKVGAAKVSQAIALGVLKHVSPEISENLYYTMVPTILPSTSAQDLLLSQFGAIQSSGVYSKTKGYYNIYIDIIKYGLGYDITLSNTYITTMPKDSADLLTQYSKLGGSAYIVVQTSAWENLINFYNNKVKK